MQQQGLLIAWLWYWLCCRCFLCCNVRLRSLVLVACRCRTLERLRSSCKLKRSGHEAQTSLSSSFPALLLHDSTRLRISHARRLIFSELRAAPFFSAIQNLSSLSCSFTSSLIHCYRCSYVHPQHLETQAWKATQLVRIKRTRCVAQSARRHGPSTSDTRVLPEMTCSCRQAWRGNVSDLSDH